MGVFCGMNLLEHPGPKGQIITRGRIDPFWFTSVRDTVAFTLMPDQPRDIRAIYVSDMARAPSWEDPGATNWIDARKAFFVIESRKQGGMGAAEAVPFGNRDAADAFAAANGGQVVTFAQIPSAYVLGSDARRRPNGKRPLERANELTRIADVTRKSHAPANDSNRCGRGRFGASPADGRSARASVPVRWHGSALGAQVSIEIFHPDRAEAEQIGAALSAERPAYSNSSSACTGPNSAICTLNRTGVLVAPDADMVSLLKAALLFSDLTDGAFDPTVQPLWQLYAEHFSSGLPDPTGPPQEKLAEALAKVGRDGLLVSADRIALTRRNAGITLNGIAQGYATDCVVDMLRNAGLSTTLVNMGEIRAIGARPDGAPWRVGLADPDEPGAVTETIDLVDRAVATTAGAGFRFDAAGQFTHLFDPATGRSPALYRTVSVIAPTATEADALSTAFSLMPASRIREIAALRPGVQARLVTVGGDLFVYGA